MFLFPFGGERSSKTGPGKQSTCSPLFGRIEATTTDPQILGATPKKVSNSADNQKRIRNRVNI
jgi:hypothetical protein